MSIRAKRLQNSLNNVHYSKIFDDAQVVYD
jgi:hypothetical protein